MSANSKKDIFAFDPGWQLPISENPPRADLGIRQAIFTERVRSILIGQTLQETVEKLRIQTSLLADPTAYFVTQHLVRIYSYLLQAIPTQDPGGLPKGRHLKWTPDSQGKLRPQIKLSISTCQKHVRTSLVDSAIEDARLLTEIVEQALQATCMWFSKGLENRLGIERGSGLSDVELSEEFQKFLIASESQPNDTQTYLVHLCAQTLAQGLVETMEGTLRQAQWNELEHLLGLTSTGTTVVAPSTHQLHEYLEIMNSSHYHAVRDALASGRFNHTLDSPWPTAVLDKGRAQGYAELRPAVMDLHQFIPPEEEKLWVERMWKQREELSDIDADALDALSAIWLRQAKQPDQDAMAGVDEILEMRGILPKKGGQGRRGGYHAEQRNEILKALSHIQNLWMNMTQMEVYEASGKRRGKAKTMAIKSRAFTITDMMGQLRLDGHMDVSQFIFRPGKVFANFLFGIGRQTALLSARALRYNPYLQAGEKRLARYLSWQWRCQAGTGCNPKIYKIETLLEVIGESPNARHPNRNRDRLEKLLDVLLKDKIIAAWQYERWNEDTCSKHGWFSEWLEATLILEPPAEIQDKYASIIRREVKKLAPPPVLDSNSYGAQLRQRRIELGLTQTVLAEKLALHQTAINRLERGLREPSPSTREKVEAWLQSTSADASFMPTP